MPSERSGFMVLSIQYNKVEYKVLLLLSTAMKSFRISGFHNTWLVYT